MSYIQSVVRGVLVLLAAGLFALSPARGQSGQPMILPVDPTPLVAEIASSDIKFSIEIADDDAERAAGLMYRRVMPDDRGMLFVFEESRRVAFWMKNTPMPLDLVFVDEQGIVVDIKPGTPFSEAPIAPAGPVRFVLELKAGTAQRTGIVAGDRMRHPVIDRVAGGG